MRKIIHLRPLRHLLCAGAVALAPIPAIGQNSGLTLIDELEPGDSSVRDFGEAVAFSANELFIGAPRTQNSDPLNDGDGRVFVYSVGADPQVLQILTSNATDDQFGDSLSVADDTLVVGARSKAAYVFRRAPGGWQETAKITNPDINLNPFYSSSTAVAGNTVVVAALGFLHPFGIEDIPGAVYVYQRNASDSDNWNQTAKLSSSIDRNISFGTAVALTDDGLSLLVGDTSSVVVFTRSTADSTDWREQTTLRQDNGFLLGRHMALSGNTLLVFSGSDGDAYFFERNVSNGSWTRAAITSLGDVGTPPSVSAVTIDGDRAFLKINAVQNPPTPHSIAVLGRNIGGVGHWGFLGDIEIGPSFSGGPALAVSQNTLALGSSGTSSASTGRVFVYSRDGSGSNDSCTGDCIFGGEELGSFE